MMNTIDAEYIEIMESALSYSHAQTSHGAERVMTLHVWCHEKIARNGMGYKLGGSL
jgi:hypothetical protein